MRRASLALLIATPLLLAQPAGGQTPKPELLAEADLIDPDCHPLRAQEVHPSRLEEPDGVCAPEAPPPPAPKPPAAPDLGAGSGEQPKEPAPGRPKAPATPPPGKQHEGSGGSAPPRKGGEGRRRTPDRAKRPKRKHGGSNGGTRPEPAPEARTERRARNRSNPGNRGDAPVGAALAFGHALPGPDFPDFIAKGTRIPRFLQPIYHAAAARYGVRWEVLAAINEVETDFGRNLNVSWAGATGWMQFMPATWRAYGTDGNGDGEEDPYDPTDAIFSAARYLSASGYAQDVRGALFAYNHATWYVEDVLERARSIAGEYLSPPAARRLDPDFASRLTRRADRAGVPWQLMLAALRARGDNGPVPASRAELSTLARRLVRLGARKHPRRAIHRLGGLKPYEVEARPRLLPHEPTFAARVIVLAHYNRAVGIDGLTRGLKAVEDTLATRVLASPRLEIYPGGRADVENGVTSPRVLALLAYLSSRYEQVGVTSLTSGHSFLTASGNVSAHSYGNAVDISTLNGTPILGHQERGGLTERALWNILLLPDELGPSELISLLDLGGPSFALDDHGDHIHAGY